MKKITMGPIEKGKVHIVMLQKAVKSSTNNSPIESVEGNDLQYIHGLHSKQTLLDNTVTLGNKTGWRNGDVSDRFNDYLIEKGYEP
jgi:hypothetical protein